MALELHVGVAILRILEGFDHTEIISDFNLEDLKSGKKKSGKENLAFSRTDEDMSSLS